MEVATSNVLRVSHFDGPPNTQRSEHGDTAKVVPAPSQHNSTQYESIGSKRRKLDTYGSGNTPLGSPRDDQDRLHPPLQVLAVSNGPRLFDVRDPSSALSSVFGDEQPSKSAIDHIHDYVYPRARDDSSSKENCLGAKSPKINGNESGIAAHGTSAKIDESLVPISTPNVLNAIQNEDKEDGANIEDVRSLHQRERSPRSTEQMSLSGKNVPGLNGLANDNFAQRTDRQPNGVNRPGDRIDRGGSQLGLIHDTPEASRGTAPRQSPMQSSMSSPSVAQDLRALRSSALRTAMRYQGIMCRHWLRGSCKNQSSPERCHFAHRETEFLQPSGSTATKARAFTCPRWLDEEHCHNYDCTFSHKDTGLYVHSKLYTPSMKHVTCAHWLMKGFCVNGDKCNWAHQDTGIHVHPDNSLKEPGLVARAIQGLAVQDSLTQLLPDEASPQELVSGQEASPTHVSSQTHAAGRAPSPAPSTGKITESESYSPVSDIRRPASPVHGVDTPYSPRPSVDSDHDLEPGGDLVRQDVTAHPPSGSEATELKTATPTKHLARRSRDPRLNAERMKRGLLSDTTVAVSRGRVEPSTEGNENHLQPPRKESARKLTAGLKNCQIPACKAVIYNATLCSVCQRSYDPVSGPTVRLQTSATGSSNVVQEVTANKMSTSDQNLLGASHSLTSTSALLRKPVKAPPVMMKTTQTIQVLVPKVQKTSSVGKHDSGGNGQKSQDIPPPDTGLLAANKTPAQPAPRFSYSTDNVVTPKPVVAREQANNSLRSSGLVVAEVAAALPKSNLAVGSARSSMSTAPDRVILPITKLGVGEAVVAPAKSALDVRSMKPFSPLSPDGGVRLGYRFIRVDDLPPRSHGDISEVRGNKFSFGSDTVEYNLRAPERRASEDDTVESNLARVVEKLKQQGIDFEEDDSDEEMEDTTSQEPASIRFPWQRVNRSGNDLYDVEPMLRPVATMVQGRRAPDASTRTRTRSTFKDKDVLLHQMRERQEQFGNSYPHRVQQHRVPSDRTASTTQMHDSLTLPERDRFAPPIPVKVNITMEEYMYLPAAPIVVPQNGGLAFKDGKAEEDSLKKSRGARNTRRAYGVDKRWQIISR